MGPVEIELRELRKLLTQVRLEMGLVRSEPKALTVQGAAKALSLSVDTVKRMIRDNRLLTVELGKRRMVPTSEIRRVTTPRGVR